MIVLFGGLYLACCGFFAFHVLRAPHGVEDEHGFRVVPAPRRRRSATAAPLVVRERGLSTAPFGRA